MTEADWLNEVSPLRLLNGLSGLRRELSPRKLALFGAACCRRVWDQLSEAWLRRLVEAAEEFADGARTMPQLRQTLWDSWPSSADENWTRGLFLAVTLHAAVLAGVKGVYGSRPNRPNQEEQDRWQCELIRDIFGHPSRSSAVDPTWEKWNQGWIGKMAATIYQERAFDRLPVLADGLQDAGCSDAELLGHMRGPGPHVPGCWVIDLLLGKA
jgi:hypothetical protein